MNQHYDIAVCGAGLVGLSFACELANTRFKVLLLDGANEPSLGPITEPCQDGYQLNSGYSPRVSALNLASVKMLENLGALSAVARRVTFKEMLVKDAAGTSSIAFTAEDIKQNDLGIIVENQLVVDGLLQQLHQADNVHLKFAAKLTSADPIDSGYRLGFDDDTTADCELLVGADGGNSIVRELAGLQTLAWDYGQNALVTTIQTELPHGEIARQWFTETGPLAFLPLADPHLCSIVWSTAEVDQLLSLDDGSFCDQLSENSEEDLGQVVACDKRFSFPLRQQQAYRYVKSNLALIGDAAHTIHPLAGQGANLGLADARTLASFIKQSVFSDESHGSLSLLNRYVRARQPHNIAMSIAMEAFKRLYAKQTPVIGWLRNTGMAVFENNKMIKATIARLASGQ